MLFQLFILSHNPKKGIDYDKLSYQEICRKQAEELKESHIEAQFMEKFNMPEKAQLMLQEDLDLLQVTMNKINKTVNEFGLDLKVEVDKHNKKVMDEYGWVACGMVDVNIQMCEGAKRE